MDEAQFLEAAEATLEKIEAALERSGAELDFEFTGDGVLEIECEDGAKIIINRHSAAREIWVAAKSGGFHFRFDNGRWVGTRDGEELFAALSRLVSLHNSRPVTLGPL